MIAASLRLSNAFLAPTARRVRLGSGADRKVATVDGEARCAAAVVEQLYIDSSRDGMGCCQWND